MSQAQNENQRRKLPFTKWALLPAVLGLFAFVAYVYHYSNVFDIGSVMAKTNLIFYVAAAACIFATVICSTLAWKALLESFAIRTTFKKVFSLSWVGIFIDAIIPGAWFGDAYKAYLLSRDPKVNGGKIIASVIVKKVFDDTITLFTLIAGIIVLSVSYTLSQGITLQIMTFMALLAAPLIALLYFSTHLSLAKKILHALNLIYTYLARKPANSGNFEARVEKTLTNYNQALTTLKTQPKIMVKPLTCLLIGWSLNLLAAFLVFASIGTLIAPDKVIITTAVVVNIQANGFILTSITQAISSTIYTALGIAPLLSITSSLLTGFASFWFKTAIAFVVFQSLTLNKQIQTTPAHIEEANATFKLAKTN